ncbi:MAG TPA: hypothetical protein VG433_17110 [Pirellulales bacterium]|nr:hypothetical protein [Pirellulales bacterium]
MTGLEPDTQYHVLVDAARAAGDPEFASAAARFRTAPGGQASRPIGFAVITCESYRDRV